MKELYELKDMLCEELKKYGKKGDLTAGSLEVVDKLSHSIKNLDKIIEKYEEGEYSGMYPHYAMEGGNRGSSYNEGSYAQRRDSRGRYMSNDGYSRMDGYSRHDSLVGELKYMMQDAPDERTKMEFQRFINKLEQM